MFRHNYTHVTYPHCKVLHTNETMKGNMKTVTFIFSTHQHTFVSLYWKAAMVVNINGEVVDKLNYQLKVKTEHHAMWDPKRSKTTVAGQGGGFSHPNNMIGGRCPPPTLQSYSLSGRLLKARGMRYCEAK